MQREKKDPVHETAGREEKKKRRDSWKSPKLGFGGAGWLLMLLGAALPLNASASQPWHSWTDFPSTSPFVYPMDDLTLNTGRSGMTQVHFNGLVKEQKNHSLLLPWSCDTAHVMTAAGRARCMQLDSRWRLAQRTQRQRQITVLAKLNLAPWLPQIGPIQLWILVGLLGELFYGLLRAFLCWKNQKKHKFRNENRAFCSLKGKHARVQAPSWFSLQKRSGFWKQAFHKLQWSPGPPPARKAAASRICGVRGGRGLGGSCRSSFLKSLSSTDKQRIQRCYQYLVRRYCQQTVQHPSARPSVTWPTTPLQSLIFNELRGGMPQGSHVTKAKRRQKEENTSLVSALGSFLQQWENRNRQYQGQYQAQKPTRHTEYCEGPGCQPRKKRRLSSRRNSGSGAPIFPAKMPGTTAWW